MSERKPGGLTVPQWKLLQDVVSRRTRTCSASYKPAVALNNCRLINLEATVGGMAYATPTEDGKQMVEQFQ